jgi:M6 family metalloprotease-like protein
MQPLSKIEHDNLKGSGELPKRLEFAKAIGNYKIDTFLVQQAVLRTARRYYQAQGMSVAELDQRAPLLAPPPAWRGMPTIGKVKAFALLIEFTDTLHTNAVNTINTALFGTPSTGTPYESLAAYYKRASYNKLDLSGGTTLGWYKVNKKRADVAQTQAGREGIIKEALKYFDQQGHNFKQHDFDGDGVVDYFMVFWTGADNGWANFWWGYQTSFSDSSFKLDGVGFGKYSWQWEGNPVGSAFNPRVAIHETGHALGLPDLYDYDGNQGPDGGVGGADMMDANQYDHNGFSKWVLDWVAPTVVGSGTNTLTLHGSGTTQDCVVVWPGIDNNDLFSEFFVVQNRQPEGNDLQLTKGGLMIWHVDARLNAAGTSYAYDNSWSVHKIVRLMEADGLEQIEANGGFNTGDLYMAGKSFGPNTVPSSKRYDGTSSGVEVRDIVETGTQIKATFSVNAAPQPAMTAISIAAWANGDKRIEVCAIAPDNSVHHIWQTIPNNGWSLWGRLGTANDKVKSLVIERNKDDRLEVFAVGIDNGIYHIWQTAPNSGWSAWGRLGTTNDKAKSLAVGKNKDGRLEVFAVGMDDLIYHIWQTAPSNGWSLWGRLGTANDKAKSLAVTNNLDGRLEVFAVGMDNGIYHIWQTSPGNGWSLYGRLGTANDKAKCLAVGRNKDGRLEIFAVGMDDLIYHIWQTAPNNGWSLWGRLGTTNDKAKSLAVTKNLDGRLEVFAVGIDNGIYHIWQTAPSNGWSLYGRLGMSSNKATALALCNNKDGRIELLTVGTDSHTYHFWQSAPNNGWSAEGVL